MKKIRIKTMVLYAETGKDEHDILIDDDIYQKYINCNIGVNKESSKPYVVVRGNGKTRTLSRLILEVADRKMYVRHKDGNPFNCLKENLYVTTRSDINRYRDYGTKLRGVKEKINARGFKRYSVIIWINGRHHTIGLYRDKETAGRKYDAARDYFSIDGTKNFPKEKNFLTEEEVERINFRRR